MAKKRKICIVTGTRAESGALYWLMKEIDNDSSLELQIIVTGMHLSPEFGLTYLQIENNQFKINKKIEILLSSDTDIGVSKAMGLAQISFAEAYAELKPDIIVVLGDRFEIFSAVATAMVSRIPVAHLNGGELTEGAIDDSIRHAITKMSHIHFTAGEEYSRRVIQLGEIPDRVFNVGEAGLDNIYKLNLLSKSELEKQLGFEFGKKTISVTYHPVTLSKINSAELFQELLSALDELNDIKVIFTKPNADMGGREIASMIDDYVSKNQNRCISFVSMGQIKYLSTFQYIDAIVGNSSSGIVEAPSFKIGSINIGDRQKGRIQSASVINCKSDKKAILAAFDKLYSKEFKDSLKNVINPYGEGGSSEKIKDILKKVKLDNILNKRFNDIKK